jgi:hypothetical protein
MHGGAGRRACAAAADGHNQARGTELFCGDFFNGFLDFFISLIRGSLYASAYSADYCHVITYSRPHL